MTQPSLCPKCQKMAGRYQCPKCGMRFCFHDCAWHGCGRPATWREMPVLPPDVDLPTVMMSEWWEHLSIALYSASALYLRDTAHQRCIALFVPSPYSPTLFCTCKIVSTATPPHVIDGGQAQTLGKLMLALPEEYQQLLPTLLKELAEHEYDATVPPSAEEEAHS